MTSVPKYYEPPNWACPPSHANNNINDDSKNENDNSLSSEQQGWTLDEIKSGVLIQTHDLSKPIILFGRAPETLLDPETTSSSSFISTMHRIETAHESCSRLHARIAFDVHQTPWLRDLQSGNGTTVNGKPVPKLSIGRIEDHVGQMKGSRGVVLRPGDFLRFGQSTRRYVLNGPLIIPKIVGHKEQQQQLVLDQTTQIQNEGSRIQSNDDHEARSDNGISWGIVDNDDYNTEEKEHMTNQISDNNSSIDGRNQSNIPSDILDIPPKHRKLFEQLTAKRYKLANIRLETERIERKGNVGGTELTEGQMAQMNKNKNREEALINQVNALEDELQSKLFGNSAMNKRKRYPGRNRDEEYDEDVDDFFDKTVNKKQDAKENNVVHTLSNLKSSWMELSKQWNDNKKIITRYQSNIDSYQNIMKGDLDKEDLFFRQNELTILKDKLQNLQAKDQELLKSLSTLEKLMKVINDNLVFDPLHGFIGTKLELDQCNQNIATDKSSEDNDFLIEKKPKTLPQHSPQSIDNETMNGNKMPPPPPMIPTNTKKTSSIPRNGMDAASSFMPPPSSPAQRHVNKECYNVLVPPPKVDVTGLKPDLTESSKVIPSLIANNTVLPSTRVQKGPTLPPSHNTLAEDQNIPQNVQNPHIEDEDLKVSKRSKQKTNASTLSFIHGHSQSLKTNKNNPKRSSDVEMEKIMLSTATNNDKMNNFKTEGNRVDNWIAPQGQDGSGYTKINEKFKGRY